MSYRNLSRFFLCLMAFLIIANASYALEIDFTQQTTNPEPGKNLVIDVEIVNMATGVNSGSLNDKKGMTIEFIDSYPFSLVRKSENIREPFDVKFGDSKKGSFYIYVDPNARSYTYPLIFEVNDAGTIIRKEVLIEIKGYPDILFDTDLQKREIEPGEKFNITLKLTNIGTGLANNIKVGQDSTNFIMIGDNLIFADKLESKESRYINLTFVTNDNIVPNSYLLPLTVAFQDSSRNTYNTTQSIGIKVLNKAKLNVRNVKVTNNKNVYDVQLRVENVGKGDAKDVVAEIDSVYQGFKRNYIGKLKPNEDLPLIFTLKLTGRGEHESFPLKIYYTDDLGSSILTETIEFDRINERSFFAEIVLFLSVIGATVVSVILYLRKKNHLKVNEIQ